MSRSGASYLSQGFDVVRDFGAVGDGVTDDTAAIQAAINAVTPKARRVGFPAGTFAAGP